MTAVGSTQKMTDAPRRRLADHPNAVVRELGRLAREHAAEAYLAREREKELRAELFTSRDIAAAWDAIDCEHLAARIHEERGSAYHHAAAIVAEGL